MLEGDTRSGGGEGSVFCFFLLIKEKNIYIYAHTHKRAATLEVVSFRVVQSYCIF